MTINEIWLALLCLQKGSGLEIHIGLWQLSQKSKEKTMASTFKIGRSESTNCCAPWENSLFNPKNWVITAKKVAEFSSVVVAICAMAILVLALIHQYPSAYGAILATCGITGTVALVSTIVASAKHCQQQSGPGIHVIINNND